MRWYVASSCLRERRKDFGERFPVKDCQVIRVTLLHSYTDVDGLVHRARRSVVARQQPAIRLRAGFGANWARAGGLLGIGLLGKLYRDANGERTATLGCL